MRRGGWQRLTVRRIALRADGSGYVWDVKSDGSSGYWYYYNTYGVRPVLCFSSALLVSVEDERDAGFSLANVPLDDLLAEIKSRTEG